MATVSYAYIGNTNNLLLTGLKSDLENIYLNDVLVTVTVKDLDGNEVGGTSESWPVQMTYIEGSEGNYFVGLSHDLPFEKATKYVAIIDADASDTSGERIGHWEFPFTGKVRTE